MARKILVQRSENKDQWFVKSDDLIVGVFYSEERATRGADEYKKNRRIKLEMMEDSSYAKS